MLQLVSASNSPFGPSHVSFPVDYFRTDATERTLVCSKAVERMTVLAPTHPSFRGTARLDLARARALQTGQPRTLSENLIELHPRQIQAELYRLTREPATAPKRHRVLDEVRDRGVAAAFLSS